MPTAIPFRKRRIVDDDDDEDFDDEYSSSSASFQSPVSSKNDDGPSSSSNNPSASVERNPFALPPMDSQEDSMAGQESPSLFSQPFKTQPSTPATTATMETTAATKLKRRKVSMSPTDSLARSSANNNKKRRTSPRKSAGFNPQQVIEIDDDDDDEDNVYGSDLMTMPIPRKNLKTSPDSEKMAASKGLDAASKGLDPRPTADQANAQPEATPHPNVPAQSVERPDKRGAKETISEADVDDRKALQSNVSDRPVNDIDAKQLANTVSKHSAPSAAIETTAADGVKKMPSAKVESFETPAKPSATKGQFNTVSKDENKSGKLKVNQSSTADTATNSTTPKTAQASKKGKSSSSKENKKKKKASANSIKSDETISVATSDKLKKKKKRDKAAEADKAPPKKKSKKDAKAPSKGKVTSPSKSIQSKEDKSTSKPAAKKGAASATNPNAATSSKAAQKSPESVKKPANKPKKRTFQDELLNQMFMSCKPYTVKSLAQLMKTNESSINFCMLSLTDKGWVIKKEFTSKGGRSKELYWANQAAKSKELFDSLRMVPIHEIEATKNELADLEQEDRRLAHMLLQIKVGPSNEELDVLLQSAQAEVLDLEQKRDAVLSRIRNANKAHSAPNTLGRKQPAVNKKKNCPQRLKKRINKMRDEWRKRKNKCVDFIDQLADGMEKKVKDVVKLLELETDEAVGVQMPPKHVVE